MAIPTPTLTPNDAHILTALFSPETLPSSIAPSSPSAPKIDASLPSHPTIPTPLLTTLEARQTALIKSLPSSLPITRSSEKGAGEEEDEAALEAALREEDDIIAQHPEYPSAYLNRAMLRRMRLETKTKPTSTWTRQRVAEEDEADEEAATTALLADLAHAIRLCLPSSTPSQPSPSLRLSPYQSHILRTAHSHRAYLHLKAADSLRTSTSTLPLGKGRTKTELEDLASADFAAAARYGDEVAREMSVRTNPYAKMCGAIVRDAMAGEREGAYVGGERGGEDG